MSPDPRFNVEVFKLLLQVVSSDHDVSSEEFQHLIETAHSLSVPDSEIAACTGALQQGKPLPAPNMGLLRAWPQATLGAAKLLIASDRHVNADEIAILQQIRELLGVDPA